MNESNKAHLISFTGILWKRRVKFLIFFLSFVSLGFVTLYMIPKYYKCESTIKILDKSNYDPTILFLGNNTRISESKFEGNTAKITILSNDFLNIVVDELNLVKEYKIPNQNNNSAKIAAINKLKSNLIVRDLQSDNLIQIKTLDLSPELSFSICNKIITLLQSTKTNELNKKNMLISKHLHNSIRQKTLILDSLRNYLTEARIKHKIIPNGDNEKNSKQLILTNGYYQNIDRVIESENKSKEISKLLSKDISDFQMINSTINDEYPTFEIIEKPFKPLTYNSYNSLMVYFFILSGSFLLSLFFLFINELKQ